MVSHTWNKPKFLRNNLLMTFAICCHLIGDIVNMKVVLPVVTLNTQIYNEHISPALQDG